MTPDRADADDDLGEFRISPFISQT
jgi:hypothetical protein